MADFSEQTIRIRRGKSTRSRPIARLVGVLIGAILVWQIARHDVPISLTQDDIALARQTLAPTGLSPAGDPTSAWSYDEQMKRIRIVQQTIMKLSPGNEPIPFGTTRELRDLIAAGGGLCYDRSRSIETVLRYLGFTVRHVSVYAQPAGFSAIRSLATPGIDSHAVTEVWTSRGWLIVSSVDYWTSEDQNGQPMSVAQMADEARNGPPKRQYKDGAPSFILVQPFTYVIGLYSRHGQFYPPFDAVPDISLKEAFVLSWL